MLYFSKNRKKRTLNADMCTSQEGSKRRTWKWSDWDRKNQGGSKSNTSSSVPLRVITRLRTLHWPNRKNSAWSSWWCVDFASFTKGTVWYLLCGRNSHTTSKGPDSLSYTVASKWDKNTTKLLRGQTDFDFTVGHCLRSSIVSDENSAC